MKKYYVEFENLEDDYSYCLQSRWFDTKEQALNWYKTNFDFIRNRTMIARIMSSEFDENGEYTDIKYEEDITLLIGHLE